MRLYVPMLMLAAACTTPVQATGGQTVFQGSATEVDGRSYPFQLLLPSRMSEARMPLVVFLHGAGERGTDNTRQLTWLPLGMAGEPMRSQFPCYLLAVQCPADETWVDVPWAATVSSPLPAEPSRALRAVMAALDRVLAEHPVDPDRVYLTGLSMGGYGAFDLAMRMPGRFAALVPVCGGGDPASVERLRGLPTWIWHGAADKVVPAVRSRQMAEAMQFAGMDVRHEELAGVGHDSWRQAYGAEGAIGWMFAQRRTAD